MKPSGSGALPEDRAVVAVDAQQRVEHRVLVRLVGDVAERPEHPAAGRHRDLGHGTELRLGQELRQVRRPGQLVGRLRVVVGAVVGVAPGVDPLGGRLDDLLAAEHGLSLGMQHAQHLVASRHASWPTPTRTRRRPDCRPGGSTRVALVDEHPRPQQPGRSAAFRTAATSSAAGDWK